MMQKKLTCHKEERQIVEEPPKPQCSSHGKKSAKDHEQ